MHHPRRPALWPPIAGRMGRSSWCCAANATSALRARSRVKPSPTTDSAAGLESFASSLEITTSPPNLLGVQTISSRTASRDIQLRAFCTPGCRGICCDPWDSEAMARDLRDGADAHSGRLRDERQHNQFVNLARTENSRAGRCGHTHRRNSLQNARIIARWVFVALAVETGACARKERGTARCCSCRRARTAGRMTSLDLTAANRRSPGHRCRFLLRDWRRASDLRPADRRRRWVSRLREMWPLRRRSPARPRRHWSR